MHDCKDNLGGFQAVNGLVTSGGFSMMHVRRKRPKHEFEAKDFAVLSRVALRNCSKNKGCDLGINRYVLKATLAAMIESAQQAGIATVRYCSRPF